MTAKDVCLWLSIISAVATGAAKYSALDEARVNHEKWIGEQSEAIKSQRAEIDQLRNDRVLLERVHAIELRLSVMDERTRHR